MKVDPAELGGGADEFVPKAKVVKVDTKAELKAIEFSSKQVVIHTYTAGSVNTDLQTVLLSDSPDTVYAFDLTGSLMPQDFVDKCQAMLEDASVAKIGYDIKATFKAFLQLDVAITNVGHDVRMGAFLVNSLIREQSLTALAQGIGYEGEELDNLAPYDCLQRASEIASVMWELHAQQSEAMKQFPKMEDLAKDIEWPVMEVLARMEVEGIGLDAPYLNDMSDRLADKISDVEQSIFGHANKEFNVSSPAQLSDVLFNDMKLPTQGLSLIHI